MLEVKTVLYLDPVTGEETLSVGYFVERADHVVLLNDIIGEDGDPQTRIVIPQSHLLLVESPKRPINITVYNGGENGGKNRGN